MLVAGQESLHRAAFCGVRPKRTKVPGKLSNTPEVIVRNPQLHPRERGMALVMSILILMVMSLLGLVLMAGVSLNRGLASNDQQMRKALNLAEAGVGEAVARIRYQETGMNPQDPADVCQIFNTSPGSVPILGADSIGLATAQPAGQVLDYSTPTRGPEVLTINWKKDPSGTLVMRYDPKKNPSLNTATGSPVYTVESTGRAGSTRRTVVTEVIAKPYQVNALGALVADVPVTATGNAVICGYDHFSDTKYDDGMDGRTVVGVPDALHCGDDEKPLGVGVPGVWSSQTIGTGGGFQPFGAPALAPTQPDFYEGPWSVFNMGQAEFWSFVGAPTPFVAGKEELNGIIRLDNNGVTQDRSEKASLHGVDGEGFLYVDGDLELDSDFHYKGLIYVEGNLVANGNAWVLGAVVVKGGSEVRTNGNFTLLYSKDTIEEMLSKYAGQFVTLSWREK